MTDRARKTRTSLLVGVIAGTLAAPLLALPAQAAPAGIEGEGTAGDPYLVDEPADLFALADAIASGDDVAAHIALAADLDMSGEEAFGGFERFTGVLDGRGHTIRDITYAGRDDPSFIRSLDGGTVSGLTLDGVTAESGHYVAGLAAVSVGGTLTGNTVTGLDLTTSGEKGGGLVAETDGGTITDNFVSGSITANEMPAGVAAYAKGEATIARNLIDADLTMTTGGGEAGHKGNDAGLVVGYPGTPNSGTYTANVGLGGTISYEGGIDGFVGRMIGFTAYDGWTATDNLASTDITISGAPVTGPGTKNQHGTDTDPAALATQSTYEELGWDFRNVWAFDETLGHPVPQYSYALAGAGTEDSPFQLASAADLEFLAAELNAGNPRYTDATHFALAADLDFAGRDPFVGIDAFSAELDGAGFSISDIAYGPSDASSGLGLIRALEGGSVSDLVLDGVTAHAEGAPAAGLAVSATDAAFDGISVIGADIRGADDAAALAAELHGESTVENSWVDGTVTAGVRAGGVAAAASDGSVVRDVLASVDASAAEGRAGIVAAETGGGATVERAVAFSGEVGASSADDGGRIAGVAEGALRDDLANETILVAGSAVTGARDDRHGADTSEADLGTQGTYERLGWDFSEEWFFDDELGHPIPRFIRAGERPNRIATTFHGDPQTSRGFSWYSTSGENGVVQVSDSRDLTDPIETPAESGTSRSGDPFHQAAVTGLEPDTRYYYRLGDAERGAWSPIGTFVTSDGESDFSFIDLTDTQSNSLEQAELSAATIEKSLQTVPGAEFVMHGGDVVDKGDREQDWSDLLDSAQPSLLSTTLAPAAGNHDEAENAFAHHFALEAPNGQDTTRGAYYSFDYNQAHFAVLNTNEDGSQAVSDAQLDWLRDDVTAARENGARWVIVSMHKGMYTTANHLADGDVVAMRDVLAPLMDELDIDLVLQGHDHVMSRSKVLAHGGEGVENAEVVPTDVITEIAGGKRAEYAVSPEGTIYFLPNTAGAKHYTQATDAESIDLEAYLRLFDRTGERDTENFAAVRVTEGRLTVDVYDIRDEGQPRLFESFGIDREVAPVDERIAQLPEVDQLTEGDADAVAEVRAAVNALTAAQQEGLRHLADLREREARIRELTGRVAADGSEIAWAAPDADARQAVTVRNDTASDFQDVPVRVDLADTPDADPDALGFFTLAGESLPYEVETWHPGGESTVWVRADALPAHEATTLWAYYGTDEAGNDPTRVWRDDYALVEHFATSAEEGEMLEDSTGAHAGEVTGGALETSEGGTAQLGGTRLQYRGDVGGDQDTISISSVVRLTDDQLASLTQDAPIVAKKAADEEHRTSFWQGVSASGEIVTRLAGNSWEFDDADLTHRFAFPSDGEEHLVTQTYDGMTYSVFVDGEEVHSQFLEYRSTYGDPSVLTTIGDAFTSDGELASSFPGSVSEVQIAGVAFSPDFERFRHANLTGDAVELGEVAQAGSDDVTVVLGTPAEGSEIEAGLVPVTGTLSHRSDVTVRAAGEDVYTGTVDAGAFRIEVPLNALGAQQLSIEAGGAEAAVDVDVRDTKAPARPEVSDDAASAVGEDAEVTLSVAPDADDREPLTTTFKANATVPLDASNTTVRTGSTSDRMPDALTPSSGTVTSELAPTTVGDDENPFQLYEIALTDEQARQDKLHFSWSGSGDERRVSAFVWNAETDAWALKDTAAADGALELDIVAGRAAISPENTVSLLVWRGHAESPAERDVDAELDRADYDWGLDHVPDTQLYAQATPDLMTHQFEYVAGRAEERGTELVIQSGDWVNREYLSQEYQWKAAEPSAKAMEDAGVPYLISWGNHDYSDARNGQVMLPKYFPHERFAASLEGSPWTHGGSHGIDNFFYTGEIDGAKLLVLTVGFFSADEAGDSALAWAQDVIEAHPDHSVILATHQSVGAGQNNWANDNVMNALIDPYSNVKLVLGGHIAGTGVATHERADGSRVYGILTDYQGRVYGGEEFLRHLSIDAENGLITSNTYSPLLDTTQSDGPYRQEIDPAAVPGFHGSDSENFALEVDLGGSDERTLATTGLSLAVGDPVRVGEPVETVGDEKAEMVLSGAVPGVEYEWFADLVDDAGNATRSPVSLFTVGDGAQAPGAPRDVEAAQTGAGTVHVAWREPGDVAVDRYEVAVGERTVTVGTLSADVDGLEPGTYDVTVRAHGEAGWSPRSEPVPVTVTEGGSAAPTVAVTGDLRQGGEIVVHGTGLEPGAVGVELHSDPVRLTEGEAADDGTLRVGATIPADTTPGAHDIVLVQGGAEVASVRVQIAGDGSGDGGGDGGEDGGPGGDSGGDGSSGGGDGSDGDGGAPGGSDGGSGGGDVGGSGDGPGDPNADITGDLPATGADLGWLTWAVGAVGLLLFIGSGLTVAAIRRRETP